MLFRSTRRGLTLAEIVVVMVLIALIAVVGVPLLGNILTARQESAIREIAQTYVWLGEEAQLRGVSFRVAINLDRSTWKIEVGDPNAMVFSNPEEAEEYAEAVKDKMKRFTKRQREEQGLTEESTTPSQFDKLDDDVFVTEKTLPDGLYFSYVYTPQYGEEGMRPSDEMPDEASEEHIAYSHIFPDGSVEHTVIQIVEEGQENDPLSVIVEPLGGKVVVSSDIREPTESLSWVPDEGPSYR